MDALMIIIIGAYVFFESFTAINEMPKIRLRCFWRELGNIYTMKYVLVGLYGLLIMYKSTVINGWELLLTLPVIFCVLERTIYRIKHFIILFRQARGKGLCIECRGSSRYPFCSCKCRWDNERKDLEVKE